MANLNIKLVKSLNGRIAKHKATAEALGLHKIGGHHRAARQRGHPGQGRPDRLPAPGIRGKLRGGARQ